MKTINDIINNPPPGVELTLVGGQALIYWTLSYRGSFPELFPDEVISSTYDVDFVLRYHETCKACADFWQGELTQPAMGDHTPELGKILITGKKAEDEFQIDLLPDLLRIDRETILKLRTPIDAESKNPKFSDYYVLSEWGTLLNRCYNTIAMKRYQTEEPIKQLRNAIAIVRACILWNLAKENPRAAGKVATNVLKLAAKSDVGIPLYLKHGIDLLSAVPLEDARFESRFVRFTLNQLRAKVESKREAWKERRDM